jgi:hypothetical protein
MNCTLKYTRLYSWSAIIIFIDIGMRNQRSLRTTALKHSGNLRESPTLTFNIFYILPQSVYVFRMNLKISSDKFPARH